jgi:hypothetical protein
LIQKRKIIRIAIFCLGVFILFNVVLLVFPVQKRYIYKDKERGEEYIYSNKKYPVVFVGSGLIGDLNNQNLGRRSLYNLFFPYNGSCTGIELIARSKKIPDTLFIETNYIFKGFNKELNEKLFDPLAYRLKLVLPCLQEKNKLLPLAKEIVKGHQPRKKNLTRLPEPFLQESLASLRKEYNQKIDTAGFHNIAVKLKEYIEYFSSRNCTIIFFEMPVDKEFLNSPKTAWERETLKLAFKDKRFIWSQADTGLVYATSDGIHLLDESLDKYIHYFNSNLADK